MPLIDRVELPAPFSHPLRVAFAADFHIRRTTPDDYLDALCGLLSGLGADLLLLGGDYGESESAVRRLFQRLNRHKFRYGAYAAVGNNDRECFPELDRLRDIVGVPVLANESASLSVDGVSLEIGGVDEMKGGHPDARALFTRDADYRILLSHYPVIPDFDGGAPADLVLSGHTHGGQWNLMGFTSYTLGFEHGRAAHLAGLREYGGVRLLVSTGMSKLPLRFGAAPRVHMITLG
jgi:predicted MPP superfamily phosphohydrolase